MRIGVPAAFARATTSATLSGPPMLPGFRRMQCAPASIAFSASVWLKWMSAMTGIGDCTTIVLQRLDVLVARDRDAHDVGARLGDLVDLVHRRLEVRGLGLRHRLHGDGRAAADRDAADHDLSRGGHVTHSTAAPARPITVSDELRVAADAFVFGYGSLVAERRRLPCRDAARSPARRGAWRWTTASTCPATSATACAPTAAGRRCSSASSTSSPIRAAS